MRNVYAGFTMFVIGLDVVVFVFAAVASLYHLQWPSYSFSFFAISNAVAWYYALSDDGEGVD